MLPKWPPLYSLSRVLTNLISIKGEILYLEAFLFGSCLINSHLTFVWLFFSPAPYEFQDFSAVPNACLLGTHPKWDTARSNSTECFIHMDFGTLASSLLFIYLISTYFLSTYNEPDTVYIEINKIHHPCFHGHI